MQLAQRAPRTLTRNADSAAKLVGILTARCGVPKESIGKVLTRCALPSAWPSEGLSLTVARAGCCQMVSVPECMMVCQRRLRPQDRLTLSLTCLLCSTLQVPCGP